MPATSGPELRASASASAEGSSCIQTCGQPLGLLRGIHPYRSEELGSRDFSNDRPRAKGHETPTLHRATNIGTSRRGAVRTLPRTRRNCLYTPNNAREIHSRHRAVHRNLANVVPRRRHLHAVSLSRRGPLARPSSSHSRYTNRFRYDRHTVLTVRDDRRFAPDTE